MKNKIVLSIIVLAVIFGVEFVGLHRAEAQTSSFPGGCSSALGYSVTTGYPCNGTNTATLGPIPGCATPFGYSVTSGAPCSGASFALVYLAGCTSLYGYSVADGKPCNGTAVASTVYVPPVTYPGLPTTGEGGNAFRNILILLASGLVAVVGSAYLARKSSLA